MDFGLSGSHIKAHLGRVVCYFQELANPRQSLCVSPRPQERKASATTESEKHREDGFLPLLSFLFRLVSSTTSLKPAGEPITKGQVSGATKGRVGWVTGAPGGGEAASRVTEEEQL